MKVMVINEIVEISLLVFPLTDRNHDYKFERLMNTNNKQN